MKNKAELLRLLNVPRTTITNALCIYKRTGSVKNLKRSGMTKKFTEVETHELKIRMNDDLANNEREIARFVDENIITNNASRH